MPIQAQSSDGQLHEFPDGTDKAVIDRVMKGYAQKNGPAAPAMDDESDPARHYGEIPGIPRMSQMLKGAAEGLGNTAVEGMQALAGKLTPEGVQSAGRDVAGAVAGGMGGSGLKAAAKEIPEAGAFRRMGVGADAVAKAKTPDAMQTAIKSGVEKTQGDIAGAPGVAPMASDRSLTEQTAKSLGGKHTETMQAEQAQWQKAKDLKLPVHDVSNIDTLNHMVGATDTFEEGSSPFFSMPRKNSVPKQIENTTDLIDLKQHLNGVDTSRMSPRELLDHKSKINEVNDALSEVGKHNSEFAKEYSAANHMTELRAERYGGDTAKQLGVDKALFAAEKKAGRPLVGKDATTNAIAATTGIADKIKSTAHVDWLKESMYKKDFDQLMSNKLKNVLDQVGMDPDALRESRELIDHIVQTVGVKGNKIGQSLDDLQAVLDKLSPKQAGVSLNMPPKAYRGKDPAVTRAVNAAKASASLLGSHGKLTTYPIAKGAEALSGGGTGEAKRLQTLRKELKPKSPITIPGAAVGSFIGGSGGGGQ